MEAAKILWADDEIAHLKAHILFLEQKGLSVTPVTNGEDAVSAATTDEYDLVFLDEHMPGLSGLEALARIKQQRPTLPVVMITKSEEENLMADAIGGQIADYLIKPVNPNQILASVTKLLKGRELVSQRVTVGYQQDFRNIGMAFFGQQSADEWIDTYRKLTYWEVQLAQSEDPSMRDVHEAQKAEANVNFGKFITQNYLDWVNSSPSGRPLLSPDLLPTRVFPLIEPGTSVFFLLIDALRYDQWKAMEPVFAQYFDVTHESLYYSLLPTATQYCRNAIFSGLFPLDIAEKYPKYWVSDEEEGGKNLHEADFLQEQIVRHKLSIKHSYTKIITNDEGRELEQNIVNLTRNELNAVVVNFIDLITHSRAEMNIVKELAPDEAAFRSLAKSWLEHSSLLAALKKLRDRKVKIVLTTDHGSIRVGKPLRIVGDRQTTTNLRYKQGRNLNYDADARLIFPVRKPKEARLPQSSVSASYVFALENGYFVYPNNYNYYAGYFNETFQHGGVSLEEVLVPLVVLEPK